MEIESSTNIRITKRSRNKGPRVDKIEEEKIEEQTIESIEPSEDEDNVEEENKNRSSSRIKEKNKKSNAKGERKQSNAKGQRKPLEERKNVINIEKKADLSSEEDQKQKKSVKGDPRINREKKAQNEAKKEEIAEENNIKEKEEEEPWCEVCYSKVSDPFMNDEMKHLFELIYCKGCGISVHSICYGLDTPLKEEKNKKFFECDRCLKGATNSNLKCLICGINQGCLRSCQEKGGEWVHSVCGIGSSSISFTNIATMEMNLLSYKKETQKIKSNKQCELCKKNHFGTIRMTDKDSESYCHLHCALRKKADEGENSQLKVEFGLCPETNMFVHQHYDEKMLMENMEDIALNLKDIVSNFDESAQIEEYQFLSCLKEKKVEKSENRGKRRVKTQGDKKVEKSLNKILEDIKNAVKKDFNAEHIQEEEIQTIGGKITISETIEKKKSKAKGQKTKRGRKAADDSKMEEEEDLNFKKSLEENLKQFSQEVSNPNSILEVYSDDKVFKLKSDLASFPKVESLTFPELLFFVLVFQRRTEAASNNLTSAEDLKKLANLARFIPFTLGDALKSVDEKYYIGAAIDCLLNPWIEMVKPKSAFEQDKKEFSETIIQRNQQAIVICKNLLDFYKRESSQVITQDFLTGTQYYQQLLFLQDFYSEMTKVFGHATKIPSSPRTKSKSGSASPSQELIISSGDEFPNVPLAVIMELSSKASVLDFGKNELEELKLLEKYKRRSNSLLNADWNNNKSNSSSKKSRASISEKSTVNKLISDDEANKNESSRGLIGKLSAGRSALGYPNKLVFDSKGRGRPKKLETTKNEVEKKYKNEVEEINQKESLIEAEKKLAKYKQKSAPKNEKKLVEELEVKIKRACAWRDKFVEAEKEKRDMSEVLEEMMEVEFRVNEMLRGVEYLRSWRLWRTHASDLERRINKKKEIHNDENENAINVEDLEQIVKEGENIEFIGQDVGLLKRLKEKLEVIKKVQLVPKKDDFDVEELESMNAALKTINIKLSETEILNKKLTLNKENERLLKSKICLKELEEKYEVLHNNDELNVDFGVMMQIKSRLSKGKDKKSIAERFLSMGTDFELGEITDMHQLVRDVQELNLMIPEVFEVEAMVNKAIALWQVHTCLFGGSIPNKDHIETSEYGSMGAQNLQEILITCEKIITQGNLHIEEGRISLMRDLCTEILSEDKTFEHNSKFHQHIKNLFDHLKRAIISESIQKLAEGTRMEIEPSQNDKYTIIVHAISEELDPIVLEIPEAPLSNEEKTERIRRGVSEAARIFPEATMLSLLDLLGTTGTNHEKILRKVEGLSSKISLILERIEDLCQDINLSQDLKNQIIDTQRLLSCCEWIRNLTNKKISLEASSDIWKFEDLQKTVDDIQELRIPANTGICKDLRSRFERAKYMKNKYEEDYGNKRREALEKQGAKIGVEEARGTLEILNSAKNIILLENEIKQIEEDLQTINKLEKSLETAVEAHLDRMVREQEGEKMEIETTSLKNEVDYFRSEMSQQALKSRKGLRLLKLFQWLKDIEYTMKDDSTILLDEAQWKKLKADGEEIVKVESSEKARKIEGFLEVVKLQLSVAESIKIYVENIKKSENEEFPQHKYQDFEQLINSITECKIALKDERKYIENLQKKLETFKEKIATMTEVKEGKRIPMKEFLKKSDELEKLPIRLQEQITLLLNTIVGGESITELCKKESRNNFEAMKYVFEKYQNCPIFIVEAEEICKKYKDISKEFDNMKKKCADIDNENIENISYNELEDIQRKAQDLEIHIKDKWFEELHKKIFARKLKLLKELGLEEQLSLESLKTILLEFERYQEQDESLKETLNKCFQKKNEKEEEKKGKESTKEKTNPTPKKIESPILTQFNDFPQDNTDDFQDSDNPQEIEKGYSPSKQNQEGRRTTEKASIKIEKEVSMTSAKVSPTISKEEKGITREKKDSSLSKKAHEVGGNYDYLFKLTDLEDYISKEKKEKENKKITQFFEGKKSDPQKDKSDLLTAMKRVLEECEEINVSQMQLSVFAKAIIATFPETLDSRQSFSKIVGKLKTIFKYPFITKRLVRRNFDSSYLSNLISKDESRLKELNEKLSDKREELKSDDNEARLDSEEILVSKKVKRDAYSSVKKTTHSSDPSPAKKIWKDEETDALTALNIERVQRTDSGKKGNPLRKLLKGENATKEDQIEEVTQFDSNVKESFNDIQRGEEVFSENEEDLKYQDVQPISEIVIEKKLLSKELKPSIGKGNKTDEKSERPILYDPDNPNKQSPKESAKESKSKSNESKQVKKPEDNITEKLLGLKEIPAGTILKIFDGLLKVGDDNKCPKVEFFTCSPFNIVNTLPQLVKDGHIALKMAGKLSMGKFEAYLNKIFNSPDIKEKIISGWVDSRVEMYQKFISDLAQEFYKDMKIGVCAYNESAKIFLLHEKQMNAHWKHFLNFKVKKVQKDANPSLYFILVHKPYKLKQATQSIAPEIVSTYGSTDNIALDLASIQGLQIIKTRNRKDSEDMLLINEQPNNDAPYEIETGGLWSPTKIEIPQREIEKEKPKENKTIPNMYNPERVNMKRSWDEANKKKKNERFEKEELKNDPTKKYKSEFSLIEKYLHTEDEELDQPLNDDQFMQQENNYENFNEEEDEIESMVKKLSKMDRETLIQTLENMEEEEISNLAKRMDKDTRAIVIEILQEIEFKPKTIKKKADRPKRYVPPSYIQKIYQLFTSEQLEEAKKKVQNGYKVLPAKLVNKQSKQNVEQDFGVIIEEDNMSQIQEKRPTKFNYNSFTQPIKNHKNFNSSGNPAFNKNNQYQTTKPSGFNNESSNKNPNTFNLNKENIKLSLNNIVHGKIQSNNNSDVQIKGNSISMPKNLFNLINQIPTLNLAGQKQNLHQNFHNINKNPFINKYVSNKENVNGQQNQRPKQDNQLNYQGIFNRSLKIFNNNQ